MKHTHVFDLPKAVCLICNRTAEDIFHERTSERDLDVTKVIRP